MFKFLLFIIIGFIVYFYLVPRLFPTGFSLLEIGGQVSSEESYKSTSADYYKAFETEDGIRNFMFPKK